MTECKRKIGVFKMEEGLRHSPRASAVVLHMLNRVDNLVDELHGHSWDDAFGISKRALESTECYTSFLCGHPREKLRGGG